MTRQLQLSSTLHNMDEMEEDLTPPIAPTEAQLRSVEVLEVQEQRQPPAQVRPRYTMLDLFPPEGDQENDDSMFEPESSSSSEADAQDTRMIDGSHEDDNTGHVDAVDEEDGEDIDEDDEDAQDEEAAFDPAAMGLKEISNLASFTVSSYKPGCGVKELRDDDANQFWQ